jgi:hypothetical protein
MGIIDDVKAIASTVQQIDNIELYRQILNLQSEVMGLVEQNTKLRASISELEMQLQLSAELIFRANAYWLTSGEGPFCSACWDSKKQAVHMHAGPDRDYYECPVCKSFVGQ